MITLLLVHLTLLTPKYWQSNTVVHSLQLQFSNLTQAITYSLVVKFEMYKTDVQIYSDFVDRYPEVKLKRF